MASRFHALEDFLIATPLHVDGQVDDGQGTPFPMKGREVEATILFADITGFSRRTEELSPVETLAFVNHFFAWVSGQALQGTTGIVDKYIGDELMMVFSQEFGAADPLEEAIRVACWMGHLDSWGFRPHVGIASGPIIVGYVGTPLRYSCSAYGTPVTLAARLASAKLPELPDQRERRYSCSVVFPAAEFVGRSPSSLTPKISYPWPDGTLTEGPDCWDVIGPWQEKPKNIAPVLVQALASRGMSQPSVGPAARAKSAVAALHQLGRYRPKSRIL